MDSYPIRYALTVTIADVVGYFCIEFEHVLTSASFHELVPALNCQRGVSKRTALEVEEARRRRMAQPTRLAGVIPMSCLPTFSLQAQRQV